jgi:hypothetical protein
MVSPGQQQVYVRPGVAVLTLLIFAGSPTECCAINQAQTPC